MSGLSASDQSSGNVIVGLGILIFTAGLIVLIDFFTTNSSANQSDPQGLLGAATAMFGAFSMWLELLLRSMIVTALALLIAGFAFVYAGVVIKNAERLVEAQREEVPEQWEPETMRSVFQDLVPSSVEDSDVFSSDSHIVGVGALVGLVFALVTNATIPGLLFWMILFGGIGWVIFTQDGKTFLRNIREDRTKSE